MGQVVQAFAIRARVGRTSRSYPSWSWSLTFKFALYRPGRRSSLLMDLPCGDILLGFGFGQSYDFSLLLKTRFRFLVTDGPFALPCTALSVLLLRFSVHFYSYLVSAFEHQSPTAFVTSSSSSFLWSSHTHPTSIHPQRRHRTAVMVRPVLILYLISPFDRFLKRIGRYSWIYVINE